MRGRSVISEYADLFRRLVYKSVAADDMKAHVLGFKSSEAACSKSSTDIKLSRGGFGDAPGGIVAMWFGFGEIREVAGKVNA